MGEEIILNTSAKSFYKLIKEIFIISFNLLKVILISSLNKFLSLFILIASTLIVYRFKGIKEDFIY